MKKIVLSALATVLITFFLFSCTAAFLTKERVVTLTSEKAAEVLKDKTEKEIHEKWGKPDDCLSGFYGDIYSYNGKDIVIYYDGNSVVTDVLISEK